VVWQEERVSHFTVLVIGDDVDEQLAPYDENLETEPRRQYLEHASDDYGRAIKHLGDHPEDRPAGLDELDVAAVLSWYHGTEVVEEPGPDGSFLYYRMTTYNPQAKWDWYQVGGRWAGFFLLKEGEEGELGELSWTFDPEFNDGELPNFDRRADQARKGQIDFEGMRAAAEAEAHQAYDAYQAAVGELPPAPPFDEVRERWASLSADEARGRYRDLFGEDALQGARVWRDDLVAARPDSEAAVALTALPDEEVERRWAGVGNIDYARKEYGADPWVQALREHRLLPWFEDPREVWAVGRDAYVQRAGKQVAIPYAVVYRGQWYAQGEMGWFGMSTSDRDPNDWADSVQRLLDALPDDTVLTLVDCHI
jgi:hypothetical protein